MDMAKPTKTPGKDHCPCGSGLPEADCCAALCTDRLAGGRGAPTPETLMRSRYWGYVRTQLDYLRATWHPSTCPADLEADAEARWLGLEIRRSEMNGDRGLVEFVARYKIGGRAHRLHESSRFVRENGHWFYLDGDFLAA